MTSTTLFNKATDVIKKQETKTKYLESELDKLNEFASNYNKLLLWLYFSMILNIIFIFILLYIFYQQSFSMRFIGSFSNT